MSDDSLHLILKLVYCRIDESEFIFLLLLGQVAHGHKFVEEPHVDIADVGRLVLVRLRLSALDHQILEALVESLAVLEGVARLAEVILLLLGRPLESILLTKHEECVNSVS